MVRRSPLRFRRPAIVIGSVVVGSVVAFSLLPALFSALPNELVRSSHLLNSLHGGNSSEPSPEVIVLGNSIAMNGIDAKQLSSALDFHPVAWNLSSGGQQIIESMFVADELPEATKMVLITTFTNDLVREAASIPHNKMISYLQYGYRPSEATQRALRTVGSREAIRILGLPKWRVALESRWALRSAIDLSARSLLRKDLNLANAQTNLFYPSPFTRQLSQEAIDVMIARNYSRRSTEQGHLNKSAVELLTVLLDQLKERDIQVALAMLPEHPALRQRTEDGFYRQIRAELKQLGAKTGAPVFSFLPLLEKTHFIDSIHPNADGAQKLTKALASEVNKWQSREND